MNIKDRVKQLKIDIPAVFLCMKARETPLSAKMLAGITVAYALSPIDLIPDFIPVLGYIDDALILPLLVFLTVRLIPREVFDKYREQACGMWDKDKPKKWYYAIPIVLIWLAIIWLIVRAIFFK